MTIETIVTIVTSIIAAASVLANVTPSQKDNEWLAKLDKFVQLLALNLRKK